MHNDYLDTTAIPGASVFQVSMHKDYQGLLLNEQAHAN